ncbi:MAG: hypothetical protein ACTHN5_02900 [Phycisphaerae bacterium]
MKSRPNRNRTRTPHKALLESLEPRQLLSAAHTTFHLPSILLRGRFSHSPFIPTISKGTNAKKHPTKKPTILKVPPLKTGTNTPADGTITAENQDPLGNSVTVSNPTETVPIDTNPIDTNPVQSPRLSVGAIYSPTIPNFDAVYFGGDVQPVPILLAKIDGLQESDSASTGEMPTTQTVVTWDDGGVTGDGKWAPGGIFYQGGFYIVSRDHAAGPHKVHVSMWRTNDPSDAISFDAQVNVSDAPYNGTTINGQVGQTFSGKIGTIDNYVVPSGDDINRDSSDIPAIHIHWGDGTSSDATLVKNDQGTWDVCGTHTYIAVGAYRITAEAGGGNYWVSQSPTLLINDSVISTAVITDPSTTPASTPPNFTGRLGVVPFSPSPLLPPGFVLQALQPSGALAGNVVKVVWGDGSSSFADLVVDANGNLAVQTPHLFTASGTYSVHVEGSVELAVPYGAPGAPLVARDIDLTVQLTVTNP